MRALREATFFLILIPGTKFLSGTAVGLQDVVHVARYYGWSSGYFQAANDTRRDLLASWSIWATRNLRTYLTAEKSKRYCLFSSELT